MHAVRKIFEHDIRLRVDYNQAYTPSMAVRAIKAVTPYEIDFADQPVKATDYLGMAYVQNRVDIPLMSHEGFFSLQDFINLVELKAIRVLGLNSERPGGVTKALKAFDYAKMCGLGVVLHNQPLGIASAMHIHFTSAKFPFIDYATELFGQEMLVDDLITKPINYSDGYAFVPDGPGWGIKLDEKALNRFATRETIVLSNK